MIKSLKTKRLITNPLRTLLVGVVLIFVVMASNSSFAYERYTDGCTDCHGDFTDDTSTKGSVFPNGDKHRMHRSSSYMNADCDLCHTDSDDRDPWIGSSNGTDNNAGLGCNGCHNAEGLRAHHVANGITQCTGCHPGDGTPPAENVKPPYYGTADTNVDDPCNGVAAANVGENWTIGDFIGTDNDGDNLYDMADFDCGPYRIAEILTVGNDIRISWETAGGRRDVLQVASSLTNDFVDVGSPITIPGVGVVTTNAVEVSGAASLSRFYRIRYAP